MAPINPDPPGRPSFRPQYGVRLEDLKRIADQAAQASRTSVWGAECDLGGGTGTQVGDDLLPNGFWARLTTPAGTHDLYSFSEVQDDGTGYGWTAPNSPMFGTENAAEINDNKDIPVPGPPTNLGFTVGAGGSLPSSGVYYVVTATYTNTLTSVTGLQSDVSNEIEFISGGAGNKAVLSWTAPAAAANFTLTGYTVWKGTSPGVETILLATVGSGTTTYTDDGTVSGSPQSPIAGGNAGPVVWMSPLSVTGFFKFFYPSILQLAWIKVTSSSSTTITLPGSATISGYPAVVDSWSNTSGTWSDGSTVWFIGANSETPANGTRYQCRLLGTDQSGVSIWATVISSGGGGSNLAINFLPGSPEEIAAGTETADSACVSLWNDENDVVSWQRLAIDRIVTGCTATSGSTAVTSASNQFISGDNGKTIIGYGIPSGTTLTYNSATSITLSQNATISSPGGGQDMMILTTAPSVTSPTGVIQFTVAAATNTQWGVVSTVAQTWAGDKTVQSNIIAAGTSSGTSGSVKAQNSTGSLFITIGTVTGTDGPKIATPHANIYFPVSTSFTIFNTISNFPVYVDGAMYPYFGYAAWDGSASPPAWATGVDGTFTAGANTVTVRKGIITAIV